MATDATEFSEQHAAADERLQVGGLQPGYDRRVVGTLEFAAATRERERERNGGRVRQCTVSERHERSIRSEAVVRRIWHVMSLLFCTRPARYLLLLAFASCAIQPELAVVDGPITIATWPFGRFANEQAMQAFADGRSRLDAVELGIREIERRSSDGSVGLGGRPNAAGYPQLDACIMDGPGHRAGSVAEPPHERRDERTADDAEHAPAV